MILTGNKINRQYENGRIHISPYHPAQLNPNSYNLRLANDPMKFIPKGTLVNVAKEPEYQTLFPESDRSFRLEPDVCYLARTEERTFTNFHVPILSGRSSLARLGIEVHLTAGFGDVGFDGYWTLEISCKNPTIIYAGMEICQIYFNEISGSTEGNLYKSKYQGNHGIQGSMLWKEF